MRNWILGTAALAIAATGASIAAQQITDEMRPQPGQYSADMSVISVNMPDAPPEIANMIGGMMNQKFNFCLTEAQVEQGFREMMNKGQQGDCSYTRYYAANGRIEAEMTCNGGGNPLTMVMEGTGSPTSSDVTMTMSGDMGMGPGSVTMRVRNNRLGDC